MPLELPDVPFDAIAVDLHLYASSAAQAVAAGEVLLARGSWAVPGVRHSIEELRLAAAISGRLVAFFRDAAAHEEEIRDFLAGLGAEVARDRKRGAA